MNPFTLAKQVQDDYQRFIWTAYPVADPELRKQLDRLVQQEALLWRGPYVTVQQPVRVAGSVADLVAAERMPEAVVRGFPRLRRLYRHQELAARRIWRGEHTVVATGTGSGKTEAFLLPLLAWCAARREERPGVKAVVLYPMNALVNDQEERLADACERMGLTYGVYTGKTEREERARLQNQPPDILLTNYSMLEYVLTRNDDRKLFRHDSLRFLVLDEVHTYQGALGTEIACLVRRLRGHVDRTSGGLVCVGLSATVYAGEDADGRAGALARIADFASALFAADIAADAVVEEEREPLPAPDLAALPPPPGPLGLDTDSQEATTDLAGLAGRLLGRPVTEADPGSLGRALAGSPVLAWLRRELDQPRAVGELADRLRALPGRGGSDTAALAEEITAHLLLGSVATGSDGMPLLRAKVHLFTRGVPRLRRCIAPAGHLLVDGQHTCPVEGCGAPTAPLSVCKGCGQDFDVAAAGHLADSPEDAAAPRSRTYVARRLHADPPDGLAEDDEPGTETAGRLRVARRCPCCGRIATERRCDRCSADTVEVFVVDAAEGKPLRICPACGYNSRSGSAVDDLAPKTAAAVSALTFGLLGGLQDQTGDPLRQRLLVFADSRQDTAFQAGYLRDRARRVLVRRLLVEEIQRRQGAGEPPANLNALTERLTARGQQLDLYPAPSTRAEERELVRAVAWDVLCELGRDAGRPGTLEGLAAVSIAYPPLEGLDPDRFDELAGALGGVGTERARGYCRALLDLLRAKGAIAHELTRSPMDVAVRANLEEVYRCTVSHGATRVAGVCERVVDGLRLDPVKLSPRAAAARLARKAGEGLDDAAGARAAAVAVELLTDMRLLTVTDVPAGRSSVPVRQVRWEAIEVGPAGPGTVRCRACRRVQAVPMAGRVCVGYGCRGTVEPFEGDPDDYDRSRFTTGAPLRVRVAEHSGQVPDIDRARIEEEFKTGRTNVLVCTQTLELGVDLGELLGLVLRNVPPRPSNYAQRAGRAGRRHERVALIATFAQGMPHDVYFYQRPEEMIRGAIRPPVFLLDNRRVLARHARSLVLESCGADLPPWMENLVDHDGTLVGAGPVVHAIRRGRDRLVREILDMFAWDVRHGRLPWADPAWAAAVVDGFAEDLDAAVADYRRRQHDLTQEQAEVFAHKPRDWTGLLARLDTALRNMRRDDPEQAYVLRYLSRAGFLPSYAFPTDVATFERADTRESISHDAVRSLTDYAPGQLVYLRGRKYLINQVDYRRSGLVSAAGNATLEGRNLCRDCDALNPETVEFCEVCGSQELESLTTLPMRAMRGVPRDAISADEERRQRSAFQLTTHLAAKEPREAVSYRYPHLALTWERGTELAILNHGRRDQRTGASEAFLVCDTCGRWFEEAAGTPTSSTRRRRTDEHATRCPGGPSPVVFRVERDSDVLHLLPDLDHLQVGLAELPGFLASLRSAFELGARIVLEADEGEVTGFDWPRPGPTPDGGERLAVLYEDVPGGAGYLRQLGERLPEVARQVLDVLAGCVCEQACYRCLMTYANQQEHDQLDRQLVLPLLGDLAGAPPAQPQPVPRLGDGLLRGRTRSPIEKALLRACIAAGLPKAEAQRRFTETSNDGTEYERTVPDLAWPVQRVAVYCDGWEHHAGPEQRSRDAERRAWLRGQGWTVLAFWGRQIVNDPSTCVEQIAAALGFRSEPG